MATGIFKYQDGNWGFRANVPGGGGKQVKRHGFASQAAAYKARIDYLGGTLDQGRRSTWTVSQWFDLRLTVIRETLRPTTASNYRFAFDRMRPYIGEVRLDELNEDILREMYRRMALRFQTDTLTSTHGRLRSTLRAAVRERRIERCVADNVTPPSGLPSRGRKTWTFEELMTFSRTVSQERDAAMWLTWITVGARRGEMCGLRWSKVLLDESEMVIDWQRTQTAENQIVEGPTKTKNGTRRVPLTAQVVSALREWRASQSAQRLTAGAKWVGSDYVFTTHAGKPYYPGSFDKRLKTLADRAKLPVLTPHELRHTFASRCLEMGMDVKLVSSMLGHSKVETTQNLYQHISMTKAHKEAAALAERMLG